MSTHTQDPAPTSSSLSASVPHAVSPRVSETQMTELVLPQHANAIGTVFGGSIMAWIDICGAIVTHRHTGQICATVSVDELTFLRPIRVGDVVKLIGRMNAAFSTSMEVEVFVWVEEPQTRTERLCVRAWLTFVAVSAQGKPAPVPPLACETDEDHRRYAEAKARREQRLARRSHA
jgi:acyl-CoA hydrolase